MKFPSVNSPSPKGGSEKGDPTNISLENNDLLKSLKGNFLSGSPFSATLDFRAGESRLFHWPRAQRVAFGRFRKAAGCRLLSSLLLVCFACFVCYCFLCMCFSHTGQMQSAVHRGVLFVILCLGKPWDAVLHDDVAPSLPSNIIPAKIC